MAKKRTSKQRNQENIAKNVGRNTACGRNKANSSVKDKVDNDQFSKLTPACNIPGDCDPISAPPKGLSNLGNTCFFNSVMQNLCRTSGLLHVLQEAAKLTEITLTDENISPLTCQLPLIAKLSESLLNFLTTMGDTTLACNGSSKNRARVESPRVLFSQICSVSPRFRTYQQQDSQELLQCLLDGIKSEEIRRRKQAILTKLGLLGKKAAAVDEEMKEKVKTYGHIACRIPTVVDIIFRGETVSSVLCDECGRITQVHEEFLDIPLPIAETHSLHHLHNVSSKKSKYKEVKEEVESKSSSDFDTEVQGTSFKANSPSKYAKKKQREQERRKKHTKKGAKSQVATQSNKDISATPAHTPEQQAASEIEENSPLTDKTNLNEQSNDTRQLTSLNNSSDHTHESIFNGNDNSNTECKSDASLSIKVVAESSRIVESDIKVLCCSVQDLSLTKSVLSLDTENIDLPKSIVAMAEEIVSNILSIVCDEIGDISKENDLGATETVPCRNSLGNKDKTQLLGGKPIPLNESTKVLPSDKEVSSNALKNHSEENAPLQGNNQGSSPSSGNDEKSDSENPAGVTTSLFETPIKRQEVKFTGFCKKLPSSLSARYEPDKTECSVLTCLHKFTMAEMLTGNNKFGCEECTKQQNIGVAKPKTIYCNASKQMLIQTPPLILTLQLKRFQQTGSNVRKLSKRVVIPPTLDLSPFCSNQARKYANNSSEIRYNLYGIVEHSGSMSRGHYTAYVHVRPETKYFDSHLGGTVTPAEDFTGEKKSFGQWYHISDTSVSKCTLDKALSCNAYLIFYEREH